MFFVIHFLFVSLLNFINFKQIIYEEQVERHLQPSNILNIFEFLTIVIHFCLLMTSFERNISRSMYVFYCILYRFYSKVLMRKTAKKYVILLFLTTNFGGLNQSYIVAALTSLLYHLNSNLYHKILQKSALFSFFKWEILRLAYFSTCCNSKWMITSLIQMIQAIQKANLQPNPKIKI